MLKMLQKEPVRKFGGYVSKHKFLSVFGAVLIAGAGYWGIGSLGNGTGASSYVLAAVEKGTLVTSVSGTGQVSAFSQVDIKPKVSGDVIYVGVKNGQEVGAGTLIAQIDSGEAQKSIRDAETNLESAKLSYEKIVKPATTLEMLQAENGLTQAQTSLEKSYDDGFNTVSDAFIDLPGAITDLDSVLYGTTVGQNSGQSNIAAYADMVKNYDDAALLFKASAETKYSAARNIYDKSFINYRAASRTSDISTIKGLIGKTYDTAKIVADAVKSASDFLSFVKDRLIEKNYTLPASLTAHQTTLSSASSKVNSHLLSLLSIKNSISAAEYSLTEKTESLAEVKNGADEYDVRSAKISLNQKEDILLDAQEKLADYYVRAPFSGTIASLDVKKNDSVSSGTSIATILTKQEIVEISLNEVDIAEVKVGQKATLTFDAVENLAMTGEVAEVDAVGTVSQGVVTYNVKINFDGDDERVKPGMSVSAAIITEVKQDVLIVPNSAVKSQGDASYVEIFDGEIATAQISSSEAPQQQIVEIGISNDASTEIISGLAEGQKVVTRTTTPSSAGSSSSKTTQQQTPSLFGGGGIRIQR